jgi:hypothetical protein
MKTRAGISAAALVAVAALAGSPLAALAADKQDPRCVVHGEGFVWWETAGTCVRVSGDLRAGFTAGSGSSGFGSEGRVKLDSRTATEFGPLRVYVSPKAGGN